MCQNFRELEQCRENISQKCLHRVRGDIFFDRLEAGEGVVHEVGDPGHEAGGSVVVRHMDGGKHGAEQRPEHTRHAGHVITAAGDHVRAQVVVQGLPQLQALDFGERRYGIPQTRQVFFGPLQGVLTFAAS